MAIKFELTGLIEAKNQPQGHATGDILKDTHTVVLLQDSATGMLLQDAVTNVLLPDSHSDVLLSSDFLASQSSLSNFKRKYDSEDRPASQVPYDLKGSDRSSQGQQKPIKPKLRDPYHNQGVMLAPTDEWREFMNLQPGEYKEIKRSQGQQQLRVPKVRDPWKGQMVSADEGEICEIL